MPLQDMGALSVRWSRALQAAADSRTNEFPNDVLPHNVPGDLARWSGERVVLAPLSTVQQILSTDVNAANRQVPSSNASFAFLKCIKEAKRQPPPPETAIWHSARRCVRHSKRSRLMLLTRQHRTAKRCAVQKMSGTRIGQQTEFVGRRNTMQSIIRGVSHIQSCQGCSRMLCQSTHRLVRRCAQHVHACSILDSAQCTSCKIARMVQVAWRVAENSNSQSSMPKCCKCVN